MCDMLTGEIRHFIMSNYLVSLWSWPGIMVWYMLAFIQSSI
ncbi:hypothetical protein UYSO10_0672 [Kosakonia radicincitans]|nr:hypothetical protein UYSO10_0672 [Kosakonia radicincitans]